MNPWARWPYNLKFRPVAGRYTPVAGGRWSVRQSPLETLPRRWRAWTRGNGSRWNRSFATFEEAVTWATLIAWAYAVFGKVEADKIITDFRRRERERLWAEIKS